MPAGAPDCFCANDKIREGRKRTEAAATAFRQCEKKYVVGKRAGQSLGGDVTEILQYCVLGCVINFLSPNRFGSSIAHSVLNLKVALFNNVRCVLILQDAFYDFKFVGLAGKS